MTIRAGYFEKTTSHAVTTSAANFTVGGAPNSRSIFLVQSDKTVHIDRSGVDAAIATSLRIPADTIVMIGCFAGDEVSFILGTGETTGTIWFTKIDS